MSQNVGFRLAVTREKETGAFISDSDSLLPNFSPISEGCFFHSTLDFFLAGADGKTRIHVWSQISSELNFTDSKPPSAPTLKIDFYDWYTCVFWCTRTGGQTTQYTQAPSTGTKDDYT
ncbi:hypothetical protein ABKN59_005522 [Abortiporus biennis]